MPFRDPRRLFAVSIVQALRLSIWAFEGVMTEIRELVGARHCWKTVEVVLPVTLSNWAQDFESPKTWRWNRPMTMKRRWVAEKSKYQPNSQLLSAEDFWCHFSKVSYRCTRCTVEATHNMFNAGAIVFLMFSSIVHRSIELSFLWKIFKRSSWNSQTVEKEKLMKDAMKTSVLWYVLCFLVFSFGELGSLIFVGREPWYPRTYGYGFEVAHELEVGCSGNGHF